MSMWLPQLSSIALSVILMKYREGSKLANNYLLGAAAPGIDVSSWCTSSFLQPIRLVYYKSLKKSICGSAVYVFFESILETVYMDSASTSSCDRLYHLLMHSVLWYCWLGGRKGTRSVKNWAVGCWRGYLSGARCRLAYFIFYLIHSQLHKIHRVPVKRQSCRIQL